jgi:uncharacterized membrane protein YjjP (DUF1212 family)
MSDSPDRQPVSAEPAMDRPIARRTLSVVIRVGSLLLASGAATEEVEGAMRSIAMASGLANVEAIVQFGTISVAYDPGPEQEPITLIRVARNRGPHYSRLAAAAELARRLSESRMTVDDALAEVERIEGATRAYPAWVTWLAAAASAGAATVLFGGGPPEIAAASVATIGARPALVWLARQGLPRFFWNVIGPALAIVIVLGIVLLGLPASGPIAVTGAILIFLPGGALAAGMRDLIDGSILSGTARVFEALLLGIAVAIGVNVGLALAAAFGTTVAFELPPFTPFSILIQAAAAAVACIAFGIQSGVPLRFVVSIGLIGAAGLAIDRLALLAGTDPILATGAAAVVIGGAGRWRATRWRASASIWIGAATLPLLPGRLLVEGLLGASEGGGSVELLSALLVGLAIGIGCALGDVLVGTIQQINESIVQPVVIAPAAGLVDEGLHWISTARNRGEVPSRGSGRTRAPGFRDPTGGVPGTVDPAQRGPEAIDDG